VRAARVREAGFWSTCFTGHSEVIHMPVTRRLPGAAGEKM
jgi:hypothetical protein